MKKLILLTAVIFFLGCQKEDIKPVIINPFIGPDLIGMTTEKAGQIIKNEYGITDSRMETFSNGIFERFENDTVLIRIGIDDQTTYTYVNYRYGFKVKLQSILDYVNSNSDFVKVNANHYTYKGIYQFEIAVQNENIYLTTALISQ